MYGYVRPEKGEMKIREYETYRGVYCALCDTLKKRYGPLFRFAVNYDLTFLAMLLCEEETIAQRDHRCPYHPLRKTSCPAAFPALEAAADYTVILAWWKLRDGAADKRFPVSLGYRLLAAFVRPACRKASALRPGFAAAAEENLQALAELEKSNCAAVDAPADCFAKILQAAAEGADSEPRRRVLRELLYHLGRIVYILDAADDLEEDERTGAYNPLRQRFKLQDGHLSGEDERELRLSLQHSHNSISAAYSLLGENQYSSILTNIIYIGLPAVTQAVFSGTWRSSGRNRSKI